MTTSILPLVPVLVLLSSMSSHGHAGHGGDEKREHYMVVETSSLLEPTAICSGLKVMPSSNGTWVPLHRPYGPCSPATSITGTPSLAEMLHWDQLHTDAIRKKATAGGEDVLEPDTPIVDVQQTDYRPIASFGIGTGRGRSGSSTISPTAIDDPILAQTMSIDTSIDLPWIQCLPCPIPECYPQQNAFFDPSTSRTSAAVPCRSAACAALGRYGAGCSNKQCQYFIDYGDGRATSGTYMTDTLTLNPSTVIMNFRFGCSHAVRGDFSGQTSGTMSLGGGRQSLLSQTAATFGNAFSYCVPQPSSSGFLSLGGPANAGPGPASFSRTPLVRNPNIIPTLYVVRLRGIEVGGRRLNVPPIVFSGGSVMDSSVIITQLPPTAYRALRLAFRNAMRAYPRVAGKAGLDTCYDFVRFTNVTVPAVSLVFEGGAVVRLDPMAVMIEGCLAFVPTPRDFALGFIGNVQQQTHEVLYDVGGGSVGFRRGAC
ncbi:hypothetical protein E2562_016253 [Oryza meyeriana var. granulata]|uniref:Peptidase A1 domain-containing protein n=1 Tax=Oryza meyeriana var. granulata TaxID=110450 RepID=A0A6G1CPL6_9ORYZ|nr:hypothetical protein E2562_016253 [Oryza meyeriana var. granulata]